MLNEVIDYIHQEYGFEQAKRLARVKLIQHMAMQNELPTNWQSSIDKVALFNGVKKLTREEKEG